MLLRVQQEVVEGDRRVRGRGENVEVLWGRIVSRLAVLSSRLIAPASGCFAVVRISRASATSEVIPTIAFAIGKIVAVRNRGRGTLVLCVGPRAVPSAHFVEAEK